MCFVPSLHTVRNDSMEATSLRQTLVMGSGMSALGGIVRALSAAVAPKNPALGYLMCMGGQILAALAQPFFLSTAAVVAANWFPTHERDIAT